MLVIPQLDSFLFNVFCCLFVYWVLLFCLQLTSMMPKGKQPRMLVLLLVSTLLGSSMSPQRLPLHMVWTRKVARRIFLYSILVVVLLMSVSWPLTMAFLRFLPQTETLTWEVRIYCWFNICMAVASYTYYTNGMSLKNYRTCFISPNLIFPHAWTNLISASSNSAQVKTNISRRWFKEM